MTKYNRFIPYITSSNKGESTGFMKINNLETEVRLYIRKRERFISIDEFRYNIERHYFKPAKATLNKRSLDSIGKFPIWYDSHRSRNNRKPGIAKQYNRIDFIYDKLLRLYWFCKIITKGKDHKKNKKDLLNNIDLDYFLGYNSIGIRLGDYYYIMNRENKRRCSYIPTTNTGDNDKIIVEKTKITNCKLYTFIRQKRKEDFILSGYYSFSEKLYHYKIDTLRGDNKNTIKDLVSYIDKIDFSMFKY